MVPYDSLASVAAEKFRWLPVRLMLKDNWDNSEALKNYQGTIEIYAASNDQIIPFVHAEALAKKISRARLVRLSCGHNEWADQPEIRFSSGRE